VGGLLLSVCDLKTEVGRILTPVQLRCCKKMALIFSMGKWILKDTL